MKLASFIYAILPGTALCSYFNKGSNRPLSDALKNNVIKNVAIASKLSIVSISSAFRPVVAQASNSYYLDDERYKKPIFNLPPRELKYPQYLNGWWNTKLTYAGSQFCANIPLRELARDVNVAGFRKYSIAMMPDVGADATTRYKFGGRPSGTSSDSIFEDLEFNIRNIFEAQYSGVNCAVDAFEYDPDRNPNRAGIFSLRFVSLVQL